MTDFSTVRRWPAVTLAVLILLMAWPPVPLDAATPSAPASATAPASKVKGADVITAGQLRAYLTFIAADAMAGRDTPSNGQEITANFLALELARFGLTPAGDNGTFFQNIAMTRRQLDVSKTSVQMGARTFVYGDDFIVNTPNPLSTEGRLVYVGGGYVVKAKNIDAYKGLDVKGKILIAHSGLPAGVQRSELRGESGPDTWESPSTYAKRHGATGIIFLPAFENLNGWTRTRQRAIEHGSLTMDKIPRREPVVPSIVASPQFVGALFAGEKVSAAEIFRRGITREPADAFELKPEKTINIRLTTIDTALMTRNVVAISRGSDPVLKDEYVALGAHYDHVGVTAGRTGDTIFNGADDNGSGTSAVLAIAEAFARGGARPKRSVLFVWHTGEEIGLFGSEFFTTFPPVPLARIVAQLNIDMIGRSRGPDDTTPANRELSGPNELYVIASKMMSTRLGEISERVNKSFLKLTFNYKFDAPNDPNDFFGRSDHYHYAKNGIPIIVYFTGLHGDYHAVGDSVDKIDFPKLEKVTRTIYATSLAIADVPERPKGDKKLPDELMGH